MGLVTTWPSKHIVPCFPYSPANSSNPYCMKFFTRRHPFVAPIPALIKRIWYISSTNRVGNHYPNSFSHTAAKQQVRNGFIHITEKTSGITEPIPPDHIIFGEYCIIHHKPKKSFNFGRNSAFPNVLMLRPIVTSSHCFIHRFNTKMTFATKFPLYQIIAINQVKVFDLTQNLTPARS